LLELFSLLVWLVLFGAPLQNAPLLDYLATVKAGAALVLE